MKNLSFKDIKDLGFQIDEDVHNVAEFYKIDLDSETSISQFSQDTIESNITESNYDLAKTTYSISKRGHIIDSNLSEQDVIDFFIEGEYKKYIIGG